jgi:hypothetical protein
MALDSTDVVFGATGGVGGAVVAGSCAGEGVCEP